MKRRNPDRRTPVDCEHCGRNFLRTKSTRYCSTACRFMGKVSEQASGCWLWTGSLDGKGYGTFFYLGRNTGAHRAAYRMFTGEIPAGLHLDHLCRTPACVNPRHLEPVTQRENNMRSHAPTVLIHLSGKCSKGHEMTPENTYLLPSNPAHRRCRTCVTARSLSRRKAS